MDILVTVVPSKPNLLWSVDPKTKTYPYSVKSAVCSFPDETSIILCFLLRKSPLGFIRYLYPLKVSSLFWFLPQAWMFESLSPINNSIGFGLKISSKIS